MPLPRRLLGIAVLISLIAGQASLPSMQSAAAAQGKLVVYAASSLTDAFKEIAAMFEANTGTPVDITFGASTQLRTQLEQGAIADVFASADAAQMDRARQSGVIAGQDQIFANNRLVVITPASNPAAIASPGDLGNPGIKIVTAQPEVPIGVYTQTMFEKMSADAMFGADFKDRANANIVSREPNVRQIVAKVQLGEGDTAVVYRSDVTPTAASELATFDIPDAFNTLASYPIAMVANAPMSDAATQFVNFVLSPEGQGALQRWNFLPAAPMAQEPATAGASAQ